MHHTSSVHYKIKCCFLPRLFQSTPGCFIVFYIELCYCCAAIKDRLFKSFCTYSCNTMKCSSLFDNNNKQRYGPHRDGLISKVTCQKRAFYMIALYQPLTFPSFSHLLFQACLSVQWPNKRHQKYKIYLLLFLSF